MPDSSTRDSQPRSRLLTYAALTGAAITSIIYAVAVAGLWMVIWIIEFYFNPFNIPPDGWSELNFAFAVVVSMATVFIFSAVAGGGLGFFISLICVSMNPNNRKYYTAGAVVLFIALNMIAAMKFWNDWLVGGFIPLELFPPFSILVAVLAAILVVRKISNRGKTIKTP